MKTRRAKLQYRREASAGSKLWIPLEGQLAERVTELARESQTSAGAWCRELIEDFVREHRSNTFQCNPMHLWERNGEDADHVRDI